MDLIKLLLVEEEAFSGGLMKEDLNRRGFATVWARNGLEGWGFFKTFQPQICVFDLMIPDSEGFDLIRAIRDSGSRVPVIILAGKAQLEDALTGLELGADDFVRKPFSIEELILRIRNLLKRDGLSESYTGLHINNDYQVGKFILDLNRLELKWEKEVCRITQKEADILKLLIERKFHVLDKKEILLKIWKEDSKESVASLHVYITRLRKFLDADPSVRIINVRGRGYRLIE